jgi:hypothetical protein
MNTPPDNLNKLDLSSLPSGLINEANKLLSLWSEEDREDFKNNPTEELLATLLQKYQDK